MLVWLMFCLFVALGNSEAIAKKCGVHEVPVECENPCQPDCRDPKKEPCETLLCNPGCHCAHGFVRDFNNRCVKLEQCSRGCGPNQFNNPCGSRCPLTCQNRHDPPICITLCEFVPCDCQQGFIKDTSTGRCIKEKDCPVCPSST